MINQSITAIKRMVFSPILIAMFLCSCGTHASKSAITAEMAIEGVSNYCHSTYDWSITEDNPSMMYVEMGEETEMEYQVIFRSYTGAFVYFYVEKSSGITRVVERAPTLDAKTEAGTIDIYDYLKKENK